MAEVAVKNLNNDVVEKMSLAEEVFNFSASETLVWEAVRAFQAAQRKGTHSTKNRIELRGGGSKPWRQKGTGRARVGSVRSPLWRGGGTVFGPRPRDYSQALPKKKRRGAVKVVLSDKLKKDRLVVLDEMKMDSFRTRELVAVLEKLELDGKILLVDERENRNLYLSSRNLPQVKMVVSPAVNIYDLLHCDHVVISKKALLTLQEVLQR